MGDAAVQIELVVKPHSDIAPAGDGYRHARHRICGAPLEFHRHIVTGAYFLECPCCGPLGEVSSPMIDRIDFSAIRGDGVPVIIEVLPGRR